MGELDGQPRLGAQPDPASPWDRDLSFAIERLTPATVPIWMQSDHYQENAPRKHIFKLKPDWTYYQEEQRAGRYLLVIARTVPDGDVVGYWSLFIRKHPHYSEVRVAIDDAHYLMPAYRKKGWGQKMLEFVEHVCLSNGARIFSMRCKADSDHGPLFEKLGYTLTDKVYLKELTDASDAPVG